ncbi:MAG: DALR domain-containing protein [Rhizomicrobium sp.]
MNEAFMAALCDDLNTPQAIAELHKGSEHELAGGLGLLGFSNVQEKIAAKPPSAKSPSPTPSPPATPRARQKTSRSPTASAMTFLPMASC